MAKTRYLEALSASIRGSAKVFLKRRCQNVFVNGYNGKIMRLFVANHDIQIVIDPYAATQYVTGYITKNEAGQSALLKAVNEETSNLSQMDQLNALAKVLDKSREVSIQEAVYRILGLQMTKSSVKVKYLSTSHPHFRDGLLKGNIEELKDDETVFHFSPHQYYESRPCESTNQEGIEYLEEELQDNYWEKMCLAEFWAKYEVVYGHKTGQSNKQKTKLIPLKDKIGFIRRRSDIAVLRYYLNYSNDEDLARGLLILFFPFRDEMHDIHQQDVKELLKESRDFIEEKTNCFEKYKMMVELISSIQSEAT